MGIADGNFPEITFMTSEVKGAGVAGVIDSPALGHLDSLTVDLTWRAVTEDFTTLAEPRGHDIDMYAETLGLDAGSGTYISHSVHVFMKAFTKKLTMGKLAVVETQDAQTEHEVYYLKYEYDGKEQILIDKYNYEFKVNGTSYLADTRRALGLM